VTVHTPKLLTREEFDSFVEFAVTRPTPNIPAAYLTRLNTLGYAAVTAKGPGAFSSLSRYLIKTSIRLHRLLNKQAPVSRPRLAAFSFHNSR
jgi:hypothetical protein